MKNRCQIFNPLSWSTKKLALWLTLPESPPFSSEHPPRQAARARERRPGNTNTSVGQAFAAWYAYLN